MLRLIAVVSALLVAGCGTGSAVTGGSVATAPPAVNAGPAPEQGASSRGAGAPAGTGPARTSGRSGPAGASGRSGSHRIEHVVWIWFENESRSDVIGNSCCGYLTRLARTYGDATHYYALGHHSADNYVGATSGHPCCYDDSYLRLSDQSIFGQLPDGRSRSLEESMPYPCDPSSSASYAVRHNPEVYYAASLGSACAKYDLPYATGSTPDLSAEFTFVTPNLCDDGHDCPVASADRWLARELPLFLGTPQYRSGTTAIFITFDEGSDGGAEGPTSPPQNRVPMIVVSPGSSGRDGTVWTHESLLATTEQILGLPKLGAAAAAPTLCGHLGLDC